jgi:hypothetical protein
MNAVMDRPDPMYSAFESDADRSETIDEFVFELAERIDGLQDAEANAQLDELQSLCDALAQDAREAGYEPLAIVAREVSRASAEGKQDAAQEGIVELTGLSRRVRLGHCGSA